MSTDEEKRRLDELLAMDDSDDENFTLPPPSYNATMTKESHLPAAAPALMPSAPAPPKRSDVPSAAAPGAPPPAYASMADGVTMGEPLQQKRSFDDDAFNGLGDVGAATSVAPSSSPPPSFASLDDAQDHKPGAAWDGVPPSQIFPTEALSWQDPAHANSSSSSSSNFGANDYRDGAGGSGGFSQQRAPVVPGYSGVEPILDAMPAPPPLQFERASSPPPRPEGERGRERKEDDEEEEERDARGGGEPHLEEEEEGEAAEETGAWRELGAGEEPLQLGFRPSEPHVDGQALRTIEVQVSVTRSWEHFCDVADTLLMGMRLRTHRPHVAQLLGTCLEASHGSSTASSSSYTSSSSSSSSSPAASLSRSLAGVSAMFGGGGSGGSTSSTNASSTNSHSQSFGDTSIAWSGLRLTVGVTLQRLRTVVIEVLAPRASAAAVALLASAAMPLATGNKGKVRAAARDGDVAGDVLRALREAIIIEGFIVMDGGGGGGGAAHSSPERGRGGPAAAAASSSPQLQQSILAANDAISTMRMAVRGAAASGNGNGNGNGNGVGSAGENDNGELDRLYVLQLRAAVVAELTSNLHAFSIPLDDWLRDHEAKSRRLLQMVEPLHRRFMPDGPPLPPPPPPPPPIEDTPLSEFGLENRVFYSGGNSSSGDFDDHHRNNSRDALERRCAAPPAASSASLIDRQRLLFGAGNSSAASALVRARRGKGGFGGYGQLKGQQRRPQQQQQQGQGQGQEGWGRTARAARLVDSAVAALSSVATERSEAARVARAAGGGAASSLTEQEKYEGQQTAARLASLRFHVTTPGGGVQSGSQGKGQSGWEFATSMAIAQADELVEDAKAPANYWRVANENERRLEQKRAYALEMRRGDGDGDGTTDTSTTDVSGSAGGGGATADGVARSLWRLLGDWSQREASARMKRKQAAVTARLQAIEAHRIRVVAHLANRPLPSLQTTTSMSASAAPRLLLSLTSPSSSSSSSAAPAACCDPIERTFHRRFRVSNEPLLFDCGATVKVTRTVRKPSQHQPQEQFEDVVTVLRRETGRLYVTFSHLWFDSPGSLLKNETQLVLPFYTLHRLKKHTKGSMAAGPSGLTFTDDSGQGYSLGMSGQLGAAIGSALGDFADKAKQAGYHAGVGVGVGGVAAGDTAGGAAGDFGARAADLILQLFAIFQESQARKREEEERQRSAQNLDSHRGSSSSGGGSCRPSPAAVDEEEILRRVQRIAELSARNANLRREFELEARSEKKKQPPPLLSSSQQQQGGGASSVGQQMLDRVESLFLSANAHVASAKAKYQPPPGGGTAPAAPAVLSSAPAPAAASTAEAATSAMALGATPALPASMGVNLLEMEEAAEDEEESTITFASGATLNAALLDDDEDGGGGGGGGGGWRRGEDSESEGDDEDDEHGVPQLLMGSNFKTVPFDLRGTSTSGEAQTVTRKSGPHSDWSSPAGTSLTSSLTEQQQPAGERTALSMTRAEPPSGSGSKAMMSNIEAFLSHAHD